MEKQKVLIVDDTPENIHVLMETLRSEYKIVAATSGAKALALAQREPYPDLILLDVMMPEMDGYQVCRRLKSDPKTEGIPIVFVTALSETGDEEMGLELGAVDFITKPFHPGLVKARVRNQLELKRHRDHLEEEVQRRTAELLNANAARQKLENELDVARRLQQSMLHSGRWLPEGAESGGLAARLKPARAVGGDLFDHLLVGDGRLLFAVGDVSDKGVAAALFMVRVLTLFRSMAVTCSGPGELLAQMNFALCEDNDALMFVTFCCLEIDLESGDWRLASGGHEAPLILQNDKVTELEIESGPALGLIPEAEFPEVRGRLEPEQTLLLYTDGATEAENSALEPFGEERLHRAGREAHQLSLSDVIPYLLQRIAEHAAGAEQSDDLTLLAFRLPKGAR